jgi:regulatory protein YycI of two-component signal transduction system YycFG
MTHDDVREFCFLLHLGVSSLLLYFVFIILNVFYVNIYGALNKKYTPLETAETVESNINGEFTNNRKNLAPLATSNGNIVT